MSHNPSLGEQLAALTGLSQARSSEKTAEKTTHASRPVPKGPRPRSEKPPSRKLPAPAWLEQARYGVELLRVHFPACFGEQGNIRPLKTGIRQDLVRALGGREDIAIADKACMVSSLAWYVNSVGYHKNVTGGADRVDLEGVVSGQVTAEEARYSSEQLQKRQAKQKKQKESAATSAG